VAESADRWTRTRLSARTATVVVGAPLVIVTLWLGGWPLAVLIALLVLLAARELHRIAAAAGQQASPVLAAGALAFPVLAAVGRWDAAPLAVFTLVMLAGVAAMAAARRPKALSNAATDVLGALYAGGLLAYVVLVRAAFGFASTMLVLGAIWANDIGAYLVGVAWGRRKLVPAISPGKSVEGFFAGLVAAAAVGAGGGTAIGWPAVQSGALAVAVALAAVAGDLWESAIKRSASVKDSGGLLPGHGGVLDRFDAVLFGVPVGYYLLRWLQ
jgi:phosphatidate cytidylyltransferase